MFLKVKLKNRQEVVKMNRKIKSHFDRLDGDKNMKKKIGALKRKTLSFLVAMVLIAASMTSMTNVAVADWESGDGHKMHYPQLPKGPGGYSVMATVSSSPPYVADDWQCSESGPVTDIHFWGHCLGSPCGIQFFEIRIAEKTNYGVGQILWVREFPISDVIVSDPIDATPLHWINPLTGGSIINVSEMYWQYNIENIDDPFIQVEGKEYWLIIGAHWSVASPIWGWEECAEVYSFGSPAKFRQDLNQWQDIGSVRDLAFVISEGNAGEECECGTTATQIEVMAGEKDNFDPDSDTDPASPSPTLEALFGPGVGFDNPDINKHFIHTFTWEDCGNITGACLEVKLKALDTPLTHNDIFKLLFSDDDYSISYKIWEETTPSGQTETILLDLSGLPAAGTLITETTSGSENLLEMLNDEGYLDLHIEDDTSVDYAKLILCCEQNPSISVEKKVSNDGGQTWHEEVNQDVCQNVQFQITVTNDGDVTLNDIVITDYLPNCLEYVSGPAVNWICPPPTYVPPYYNLPGTNTPTWKCSELPPGSSALVTYTAHVVESGGCENQVSVEGEYDGQIVTDTDCATVIGVTTICLGTILIVFLLCGGLFLVHRKKA
ncbi:MAG: hypothetical protein AYK18_17050 [Theionarchaea archaeon DG-70]|nr:MAG: hypothetical protein AYK18_17050 [Theionarchaea archaeon DG-70]